MFSGSLRLCAVSLVALTLLLAGCGQESDLHSAGKPAPTPTVVPAMPTNTMRPGGEAPLPTLPPLTGPVPTAVWPTVPAPGCPARPRPEATGTGTTLPVAVPTIGAMRLIPPVQAGKSQDTPATFVIPPDCNGRVLEMHVGETLDILVRKLGGLSAATAPQGILQSGNLQIAGDGLHWRFSAIQPGTASLSIYVDIMNYLNLGVIVY
jgi:hypothetical protein